MRRARFPVTWPAPIDGTHRGTVTVDRSRGLFCVRPLRRRREYVLPLGTVAALVVWRLVGLETRERAKELRERRKERARARRKV